MSFETPPHNQDPAYRPEQADPRDELAPLSPESPDEDRAHASMLLCGHPYMTPDQVNEGLAAYRAGQEAMRPIERANPVKELSSVEQVPVRTVLYIPRDAPEGSVLAKPAANVQEDTDVVESNIGDGNGSYRQYVITGPCLVKGRFAFHAPDDANRLYPADDREVWAR